MRNHIKSNLFSTSVCPHEDRLYHWSVFLRNPRKAVVTVNIDRYHAQWFFVSTMSGFNRTELHTTQPTFSLCAIGSKVRQLAGSLIEAAEVKMSFIGKFVNFSLKNAQLLPDDLQSIKWSKIPLDGDEVSVLRPIDFKIIHNEVSTQSLALNVLNIWHITNIIENFKAPISRSWKSKQ